MSLSKMSDLWERAKAWLESDELTPEPAAEVVAVQRAQPAQATSGPSWSGLEPKELRQRWPEEILGVIALAGLAGLCTFGLVVGERTVWANLAARPARWLVGDLALVVPAWLAFAAWRLWAPGELARRATVATLFVASVAVAGVVQLVSGGRSSGVAGTAVAWVATRAVGGYATLALGALAAGCLLATGWAAFVRLVARFAPGEDGGAVEEPFAQPETTDADWTPPPPDLLARGSR